jgi:hypothetical protein
MRLNLTPCGKTHRKRAPAALARNEQIPGIVRPAYCAWPAEPTLPIIGSGCPLRLHTHGARADAFLQNQFKITRNRGSVKLNASRPTIFFRLLRYRPAPGWLGYWSDWSVQAPFVSAKLACLWALSSLPGSCAISCSGAGSASRFSASVNLATLPSPRSEMS